MFMFMFFTIHFLLVVCEWKYEPNGLHDMNLEYSIISTKITKKKNLEQFVIELKNGVSFEISFASHLKYNVFIKEKSPAVINSKTEFFVYENNTANHYNESKHSYELVEGYVEEKMSSYVIGYVQDEFFYGKLQIDYTIFYIEELAQYPEILTKYKTTKNAIAFKRIFKNSEATLGSINYRPERNQNNSKIFKRKINRGNICSLLVLVDNSFMVHVHNGNVNAAIKQVMLSIDEANSVYRSTDFDGDRYPDNIGFVIKYFILLKSSLNDLWIPKYSKKPIDGRFYMHMFSRFYLLRDVCLGVAFTGQSFQYAIVGISYASVAGDEFYRHPYGGICDRPMSNPYGWPLNTLAVSARSTTGQIVPQHIFELSLFHEIGHSFGAEHDNGSCEGYLMTAVAPKDQNRKHFEFSKCSTKAMINTIIERGDCFESDNTPFCGNGIIESGEICDCGTIRDCLAFDKCCTPRGRNYACNIKRWEGYQCHPMQGLCCDDNCLYKNLENYGLDCRNFEETCPCRNTAQSCKCGIDGYCIEKVCNSYECTRIDAEECECPKSKGGCQTCCLSSKHNLSCTTANIITRSLFILEDLFQKKFYDKNKRTTNFGFYEKFCQQDKCIQLFFRKVQNSNYCLLFGNVGICSKEHKCLVPSKNYTLRKFEFNENKNKTRKSNSVSLLNVFWSIFVILKAFINYQDIFLSL